MTPPAQAIRVDAWTLRCYFNRAQYRQKSLTGEISTREARRGSPPKALGYAASVETYYLEKGTGIELARTHHYELADGSMVGRPDPKALYLNGQRYRLHRGSGPGADLLRDPEKRFRRLWMKKTYAYWRKLRCALFGS